MNDQDKNQMTENGQIKDDQALVQSAGDSDGISTSTETKEELRRKKTKQTFQKKDPRNLDPAKGREWTKH